MSTMRMMIIDRDRNNASIMKNRLEQFGYEIEHEPSKNEALERLQTEQFDAVFVDPAPLTTARPFIISLRRALQRQFVYVSYMAHGAERDKALGNGMNDALSKPVDQDTLPRKVENARRMIDLVHRLADESFDFPNEGGILGKSAMNQLLLTSLDRADRYGEESYMLFISVTNTASLKGQIGEDKTEKMVNKVGEYLGRMRRQSDITGRTGMDEFGSLILRPMRETEPVDAAARFHDILKKDRALFKVDALIPDLKVELVNIPTGEVVYKFDIA